MFGALKPKRTAAASRDFLATLLLSCWNRLWTLFELAVVDNPRFAVDILMISVMLSEIHGHIAIFGCPSMSLLFVDTFLEFAVVENFDFASVITIILTTKAFGCMSQREREISPVSKLVFDVMPNNFRCNGRRFDGCILYPIHI